MIARRGHAAETSTVMDSVPRCVGEVSALLVARSGPGRQARSLGRRPLGSARRAAASDGQRIEIAHGAGWYPRAGQRAQARAPIVALTFPPLLGWGEVAVD